MSDQAVNSEYVGVDKNININMIQNKIVDEIGENKKGRKRDDVRKYFTDVIDSNDIKCTLHNCGKKFSCKTSVSNLKYHILQDHGQIYNKKTKCISIVDNMEKEKENQIISETEIHKKIAIAFAKNSLPYSLLEDKYYRDAFDAIKTNKTAKLISKKNLRDIVLIEGNKINENFLAHLAINKTPVTLAIDGWTNVRSNKVTNLLLIAHGISYFIASIENEDDKNNTEWLVPRLEEKIKNLLSNKINIIAIAADNENLMKATIKKLKLIFPVLINVPCAAHIIQLCFKKICEEKNIKNTINEINNIIHLIRNSKENRNKLHQLQLNDNIKEPLKIKYHTEIRWTSLINSMERILLLKKYIIEIVNGSIFKLKSDDKFWNKMNSLYEFLKLFNLCTNQIQKDNATLYSTWINFNKLTEYYSLIDTNNEFTNNANLMVEIIKEKWNKHINVELIDATRLFNFEQNFQINDNSLKFIEEWGSKYLIDYSLVNKDINTVKHVIYLQLCEFLPKQKRFADIDNVIMNVKKACEIENVQYCTTLVWGRFYGSCYELSKIAIAILSICPTESTVERSFSALSDIHTLERNRLANNIIEAELKIKWNIK
jgi:hypothetical protein